MADNKGTRGSQMYSLPDDLATALALGGRIKSHAMDFIEAHGHPLPRMPRVSASKVPGDVDLVEQDPTGRVSQQSLQVPGMLVRTGTGMQRHVRFVASTY